MGGLTQVSPAEPRRAASHPCVSANPRASVTKGCTSPRVPRVIMNTSGKALAASSKHKALTQPLALDMTRPDSAGPWT